MVRQLECPDCGQISFIDPIVDMITNFISECPVCKSQPREKKEREDKRKEEKNVTRIKLRKR